MPLLLVIAFVVVPLVELAVIQQVASALTLGPTLLLLLLDSVLGAVLVRREGSRAWTAFREALAAGRVPADEIIEGVLLLFGGALLLTPGFVTDVVGLALVVPLTRVPLARLIKLRGVPIQFQVGTAGWNRMRGEPGGEEGARRPIDGRDVARPNRGGDAGLTPGVEVISVERDDSPVDSDG